MSSKRKNCKKKDSDANIEIQIDWQKIASSLNFPNQTPESYKERYLFLKATQAGKGPWSADEDQKIVKMVKLYGKLVHSLSMATL